MINVVYDSMYQYGTMDNQWLYGFRGDLWTSFDRRVSRLYLWWKPTTRGVAIA